MTDVRIEHRFDCSENTFWEKVFFNEDFNRGMYLDHLNFRHWEVAKSQETELSIIRTVNVIPKVGDLPGAIKSLIGDNLGYREEGTFDKKQRRYRIRVVPTMLDDKISVRGETWLQPLGPTKCNRVFDAQISVKVFGVGNLIEKRLIADLQLSYNAGATYTIEYLKKHGLTGT